MPNKLAPFAEALAQALKSDSRRPKHERRTARAARRGAGAGLRHRRSFTALRKEQVDLANVIARAVETAQPLIAVQGHRLELSLPHESLLLDADPVRLAQVVGNLLTNAAKYTEANGNIWVSASREDDGVVLRVKDDGIGIAADTLRRFLSFHRDSVLLKSSFLERA